MVFTDSQWAEDADRIHKWPLSEELRSRLLSPEQVALALDRGENPISLSIQKWEALQSVIEELGKNVMPHSYYAALQDHIGMDTCALCSTSKNTLIAEKGVVKAANERCNYCPFSRIDQCTRESSIFAAIERILLRGSTSIPSPATEKQLQSQLEALTEKMIVNLKLVENRFK